MTLIPIGGFPSNSVVPNDNLIRPTPDYFTEPGISYAAGGNFYNLYYGRDLRECSSSTVDDCSFGSRNQVTGFSVTPAAVPEPATWAMMLAGFSIVGAATRYRRRASNTVYA